MKRDFPYSNTSVERAEVLFDLAIKELNPEPFMGAARDEIIEELCNGEKVDRFRLVDVLDCELNERYSVEISRIADLLLCDDDEREQYKQRLVSSFVDSNVRLIEDRAQQLAEAAEDDAELWRDE
jgi:hypothetical protein